MEKEGFSVEVKRLLVVLNACFSNLRFEESVLFRR